MTYLRNVYLMKEDDYVDVSSKERADGEFFDEVEFSYENVEFYANQAIFHGVEIDAEGYEGIESIYLCFSEVCGDVEIED